MRFLHRKNKIFLEEIKIFLSKIIKKIIKKLPKSLSAGFWLMSNVIFQKLIFCQKLTSAG